jgi:segregation and condensation protein B
MVHRDEGGGAQAPAGFAGGGGAEAALADLPTDAGSGNGPQGDGEEPRPDPAPADPAAASADPQADVEVAVGAGDALSDAELSSAVAALVYASPEPISERRLQTLLEGPQLERVRAALQTLRERLASSGLPYELRTLAGGYQILTTADVGEIVQRLAKVRRTERISGAALETLAVVAYRQPVTKAEIEAIRGVQAGPILRTLLERGLVRVAGRADVPGHPLQYGTTREFLDRFGLASLADLPRDGELAKD